MMVNLEARQHRQLRIGCVRYGTGLQSEIPEKMTRDCPRPKGQNKFKIKIIIIIY